MPKLYIIAGPNGAGKTTFAKEFLPHYAQCPHFVNADLIAQGLSPFSPALASIKAGRLLSAQIEKFMNTKLDFAFETTFAGRSYAALIQEAKRKGYSVTIFFLWIPDVKLALERIKQRVKEGGHDVPEVDIIRRFQRSRINFGKLYLPLCDSWILFDNSGVRPVEIGQGQTAKGLKISNKELFERFMEERL